MSDEEESGGSEEEEEDDAQASSVVEDQSIKEEKEKARLDELWASFKTEVKGKVTDRLTTPSFIPTSKARWLNADAHNNYNFVYSMLLSI